MALSCHDFLYTIPGGFDFFSMRNYKDTAETFPRELPWLMSKLLQLCLLKSFLPLSLGNLSVTPVKHQQPIYERLHATSSVRSNETSSNWACFILLQLGNILSNREGQNSPEGLKQWFRKLRAGINSLKSPFSMMEQSYMEQGQFKINGLQR